MNKLIYFQKVNHFPANRNIVRKDLLNKSLQRIRVLSQKLDREFDILPLTFSVPKEYCQFSAKFHEDSTKDGDLNIWIVKPVGKSQGRGIQLINNITQLLYAEPIIVQKYLRNPLLLEGHKFDLRIYVLVTSFSPIEAFIYKEGFARLSMERYRLDADSIKNNNIHLTNYAVQVHNVDRNINVIGGCKISLQMLQEQFRRKRVSWSEIWEKIIKIVIKSLIACGQDIKWNPNCFEIFGYDIMIDEDLHCWLLEVNSSPSLAREFIIDDLVKQSLIDDAIDLIAPIHFDRSRLLCVLERRIREKQGSKTLSSYAADSKLQLNRDLNFILQGQPIRKYGEMPANVGQFEMICPSQVHDSLIKEIQSHRRSISAAADVE